MAPTGYPNQPSLMMAGFVVLGLALVAGRQEKHERDEAHREKQGADDFCEGDETVFHEVRRGP